MAPNTVTPKPSFEFGAGSEYPVSPQIRAVSFDVFDTLVVRSFRRPVDLFLALEHELVRKQGSGFVGFAQRREEAERAARRLALQTDRTGEVSLRQIYAQLQIDDPAIPQMEIDFELTVCRPRTAVIDFYRAMQASNRRIFLLSDMYLPREVIEQIFQKCGITAWDLFLLSNEELCSKHDGGLFARLLEVSSKQFGLQADEILHLGDNEHSDVKKPLEAGLAAQWIPREPDTAPTLWSQPKSFPASLPAEAKLWVSACHSLTASYLAAGNFAPERLLGFEATGPLAASFCAYIRETALRLGRRDIHFAARDGLVLKRVFDTLFHDDLAAGKFRTHYLLTSRRCLLVGSIERPLSYANVYGIARHAFGPLPAVLKELGVPFTGAVEAKVAKMVAHVEVPAEQMDRRLLHEVLFALSPEICAANWAQRDLYRNYLRSCFSQTALLVDLGWGGTIQDCLDQIFESMDFAVDLHGVYLGTSENFARLKRDKAYSYLYEMGRSEDKLAYLMAPLELLFAAPEGSIKAVELQDGAYVPQRLPIAAAEVKYAEHLQAGALDFAVAARPLIERGVLRGDSPEFGRALVDRLLRRPTRAEAMLIGDYVHANDFAHHNLRSISNFEAVHAQGFFRAYADSWWPYGLVARLGIDPRLLEYHSHRIVETFGSIVRSLYRAPLITTRILLAAAFNRDVWRSILRRLRVLR